VILMRHSHPKQCVTFAQRTQWPLQKNPLTQRLAALRDAGQEILDLTVSNPTQCGFPVDSQATLSPLSDHRNISYEPCPHGILEAREALCRFYAARGFDLAPERIFLTASTSEAYAFLFRLLADPGDSVLFPQPSYPLFDFLGGLNDVAVRYYPLIYEKRWRPDLEMFQSALEPGTRAVVVVNPNNPTGSFIRRQDFSVMAELCTKRGIPIISDEVFYDYRLNDGQNPVTLLDSRGNLTFVLGGLSKALALPQMKLAWVIINGPDGICRQACERLEIIADTYLSAATPIQNALKSWLTLQPKVSKMIMKRLRHNYATMQSVFGTERLGQCLETEGGWNAVARLPMSCQEESFVLGLLQEQKVLVYPGFFFDFREEPVIVVSLLPDEKIFQEAMARLQKQIKVVIG